MMGLQKRLQRYFNLLNSGFDFTEEIKEVKRKCHFYQILKMKGSSSDPEREISMKVKNAPVTCLRKQ